MKKYFFLLAALLLVVLPLNATLPFFAEDDEEGDPEEIIIEQKGNENPTSLQICTVQAYKTNLRVYVSVNNFSGNVIAVVSGIGGSSFVSREISSSALLEIDISAFNAGSYTLLVSAGNIYEGHFVK